MATFQVNNKSYINQIATLISLSTRPRILHAIQMQGVKVWSHLLVIPWKRCEIFLRWSFLTKIVFAKGHKRKNKGFKQNKTKQQKENKNGSKTQSEVNV